MDNLNPDNYEEIIDDVTSDFTFSYYNDIFTLTGDVKEENRLGLEFRDAHKIVVYSVCPNIEILKSNRELLKKLKFFESKGWALNTSNRGILETGGSLIECEIDLTKCLDLIDRHDMDLLYSFSKGLLAKKIIKKGDKDFTNKLISYYCNNQGIQVVRKMTISDKVSKDIGIKLVYIGYKILDSSCVTNLKEIK